MARGLKRRRQDRDRLLKTLVELLGDDFHFERRFPVDDDAFADLLPTTWPELEGDRYLESSHAIGQAAYVLTARGWCEGLRLHREVMKGTNTWKRAQHLVEYSRRESRAAISSSQDPCSRSILSWPAFHSVGLGTRSKVACCRSYLALE
jgi:hypothetical protein